MAELPQIPSKLVTERGRCQDLFWPSPLWMNRLASLLIAVYLTGTTMVNVVYLIGFDNIVRFSFSDLYGAEQEWNFSKEYSGPINSSLVEAFAASRDSAAAVEGLLSELRIKSRKEISSADACVAQRGRDGGSVYAICDRLDQMQLPEWAKDFEAIALQTIPFATVAEFRHNRFSQHLTLMQSYHGSRSGWFRNDENERKVCTSQQLARSSSEEFVPRVMYTQAHGLLQNVNCLVEPGSVSVACKAIRQENPSVVVFEDGSNDPPEIFSYEVFQTSTGMDLIMVPWLTRVKIGLQSKADVAWPNDGCMHVRGAEFCWFGVGYRLYSVTIPAMALVAKVQLILVVSAIGIVKYRAKWSHLHDALCQSSRLGIFFVLVVQILISSYYEQDIMRTIYAWYRTTAFEWVLFIYLMVGISASVSLLALQLVRMFCGNAMSMRGCFLAVAMAGIVPVLEFVIAQTQYATYTEDNGLQYDNSVFCGAEYNACTQTKFNFLLLVYSVVFIPCLYERHRLRRLQRERRSQDARVRAEESKRTDRLTTFEQICLDGHSATEVIPDFVAPRRPAAGHAPNPINPDVVTASGFTMIKDRFLARTKDLGFVIIARMLPTPFLRFNSVILWSLKQSDKDGGGALCVEKPRRVFLRETPRVKVSAEVKTSIIHGTQEPVA